MSMLTAQQGRRASAGPRSGGVRRSGSFWVPSRRPRTWLVPAGAAIAQPRSAGLSPARAPATAQRASLTAVHLVTGVVRDQSGHPVSDACVLAASATGQVTIARTGAAGQYQLVLPRTGAYTLSYRVCEPGHAVAGPVLSRHIVVGGSAITSLPAMTLQRRASASPQAAVAAAGVVVPRHRRIIVAQPGEEIGGRRARAAQAGDSSLTVVTGKVTNPAGRPLAGICMWLVSGGFRRRNRDEQARDLPAGVWRRISLRQVPDSVRLQLRHRQPVRADSPWSVGTGVVQGQVLGREGHQGAGQGREDHARHQRRHAARRRGERRHLGF